MDTFDLKKYLAKNPLLKEITESKQVGTLYHFTPLKNLIPILDSQVITPNSEKQISTTRRADMDISGFMKMQMGRSNVARLTLDGDKISTKYKIRPFVYFDDEDYIDGEDLGEEQIITNGKNFSFLPYLKRIDLFVTKKEKNIDKTIDLLSKMNIPYKIYKGTPKSNTPYIQSKEGDPTNIKYTPINQLPDNTVISKDLYLSDISRLPENLIVKGNLTIENSKNIKLPTKLTVKGFLQISNCGITSLPKELIVGGLGVADTPITSLPDNLKINGIISFHRTNLSSLPDNLVTNNIMINVAPINKVPNNLNVSFLTLIKTPLNEKYNSEQIKELIINKGGKVRTVTLRDKL